MQVIQEKQSDGVSGFLVLLGGLVLFGAIGWHLVGDMVAMEKVGAKPSGSNALVWLATITGLVLWAKGFFVLQPNQANVLQFFGSYVGTASEAGLRWTNPLYAKSTISVRVRTTETPTLKVNDIEGNPIEIRALLVWKVGEPARAMFEVDAYERFIAFQSEAALRNVATKHPYDSHEEHVVSLRGHIDTVAADLGREVASRIRLGGLSLLEARITHLAYAPEIAHAMLQRQQAGAIIAARQRIVEGAVGMVEMALNGLAERQILELDPDKKAQMVSNLLVVLCGDKSTQPVINTGTLHS